MELFFDITTFEPKASEIIKRGLLPLCDHKGFLEGQFCCLACSIPLFDKDDLYEEGHLFYGFMRPLSIELFNFEFNVNACYPNISLCCKACGNVLGTVFHETAQNRHRYHVMSRSVFLAEKKPQST